ncbi:hypothetical protein H0H81_006181 [Sphagnurus paluster]|uniref:Cytochrome P450 n=1 Tax=Sphagnurus paluster TaxID=117069 RepID=A0A9P7GEI0_9AGAR|nr:hypothetical protein H0H81_006181 [Sphagnurus paluster]
MPKTLECVTYHKWSQEFGEEPSSKLLATQPTPNLAINLDSDIIHLDVLGRSIIVLDSEEATTELLEKRSSLYSGRPRMPMINELMGRSFDFGFMTYGKMLVFLEILGLIIFTRRSMMHQQFHPNAATRFQPYELKACHGLLRRLLDDPTNLLEKLRHMAGETIMEIAYGLQIQEKDDPYIVAAERAGESISIAAVQGAFLVDVLPILKYVPDWMPFAGFKRRAKEWRELTLAMVNHPFQATMRNIESGHFTPSFVSYSLENIDEAGDVELQKDVIKSTAGIMYSGQHTCL